MSSPRPEDPRSKNKLLSGETVGEYLTSYQAELSRGLSLVSKKELERALECLKSVAKKGARIFVAGNGGSSAIADHLCCDFVKSTYIPKVQALCVHSLVGSTALLTALGNDCGYEHVFSTQLEIQAKPGNGDVLLLISSSGNSPNIVKAAELARNLKMPVLGLSGFSGGKLKELSDISLHVPIENYGIVEDAHQSLMHVLTQFLYLNP